MFLNQSCANSLFSTLVVKLENEGTENQMHSEPIWTQIFHRELIFNPFQKSAQPQT